MLQWLWVCRDITEQQIWSPADIYLGMWLLDRMVVQFLSFWGTSIVFSLMGVLFTFPPILYKGSLFSTSLPTFIFWIFDKSYPNYPNRCEVIHQSPLPFFFKLHYLLFLLLSSLNSLYILDVNPLSDILFGNIFSHSLGCFFSVYCFFLCAEAL